MLQTTCARGAHLPSRFAAAVFGDLVRASCTGLGRARSTRNVTCLTLF